MRGSPKGDMIQKRYRKQTETPKKDSNTVSGGIDKNSLLRKAFESLIKIREFREKIAEILQSGAKKAK